MAEKLSSMSKAQATSTEFCSATLLSLYALARAASPSRELGVGQTGMVNIVTAAAKTQANCVSG
jgi:hypothetical protein